MRVFLPGRRSTPDVAAQGALTQNTSPKGRSPARLFALVIVLLFLVGGGSFLFARQTSPDARVRAASTAAPVVVAPPPSALPAPVAPPPTAESAPPVSAPSASVPEVAPPPPRPVVWQRPRAVAAPDPKKSKKKGDDEVDLRNPYRQ